MLQLLYLQRITYLQSLLIDGCDQPLREQHQFVPMAVLLYPQQLSIYHAPRGCVLPELATIHINMHDPHRGAHREEELQLPRLVDLYEFNGMAELWTRPLDILRLHHLVPVPHQLGNMHRIAIPSNKQQLRMLPTQRNGLTDFKCLLRLAEVISEQVHILIQYYIIAMQAGHTVTLSQYCDCSKDLINKLGDYCVAICAFE